jgi:hypothetical protein
VSVTFSIRGAGYDVDDEKTFVNVSNTNARDLLIRLGLGDEPGDNELRGNRRAKDLARRCRDELTAEKKNQDTGIEGFSDGRFHFGGRSPGLLNRRIQELLDLCERAGDLGVIYWG